MEKAYICSPLSGNEIKNINNAIAMQSSFTTDVK